MEITSSPCVWARSEGLPFAVTVSIQIFRLLIHNNNTQTSNMREACVRVKLFILSPVMKEEKNYTQAKL